MSADLDELAREAWRGDVTARLVLADLYLDAGRELQAALWHYLGNNPDVIDVRGDGYGRRALVYPPGSGLVACAPVNGGFAAAFFGCLRRTRRALPSDDADCRSGYFLADGELDAARLYSRGWDYAWKRGYRP